MNLLKKKFAVFFAAFVLLLGPLALDSMAVGNISAGPIINLTMTIPASITSVCTGNVNFTQPATPGLVQSDAPAVCTNTWTTAPASGYVRVVDYMFFGPSVAGLYNGVTSIPTANVFAGMTANPTLPCNFGSNQNCFGVNAIVNSVTLGSANWSGSATYTFYFALQTAGITLTAGSYTGQLNYIVWLSTT